MSASRRMVGLARGLALALLASTLLLPLLPLLAALQPGLSGVERLGSGWFDLHCARDPARTLQAWGVPLAVCARCSGIYFGLGAGALFRWPRLAPVSVRRWVGTAAAFMVADVLLEHHGFRGPWAALRLATGLLLGYPVGVALGQAALGVGRFESTHKP